MSRRILITMPGTRGNQMRYVEAINQLGLGDHVDYCLQVSSTLYGLYPSDMADMDDVAVKAYDDAKTWANRYWVPKPYTHCMYDYEPDGWQVAKIQHGYDEHDRAFIGRVFRGLQMSMPDAKRSMYRVPITHRGIATQGNLDGQLSIKDSLTHQDWVWLDTYPQGHAWINEDLSSENIEYLRKRIMSQYRLASMLHKPLIPTMFLHYHQSVERCKVYHEVVMSELNNHNGHIGIWTDLNVLVDNQIARLRAIAPALKEWVGV